jgi:hypothetical protein
MRNVTPVGPMRSVQSPCWTLTWWISRSPEGVKARLAGGGEMQKRKNPKEIKRAMGGRELTSTSLVDEKTYQSHVTRGRILHPRRGKGELFRPRKLDEFQYFLSILPSSMDLVDLLQRPEGRTLEFKRELSGPDGVLKSVVAFANTAGGTLILGVEDRTGHVRGVAEPLDLEERLANLISDHVAPSRR